MSKIYQNRGGRLVLIHDDSKVVHTTGNETISGRKNFTAPSVFENTISRANFNYTRTTSPSEDVYCGMSMVVNPSSGEIENRLGALNVKIPANSTTVQVGVGAFENVKDSPNSAWLTVYYPSGESPYATAPSTLSTRTGGQDILTRNWIPQDSRIVHTSGAETISGVKTFNSAISISNPTDNPHTIKLTSDDNNYAGIWDSANAKWLLYSDNNGNASFVGNATTATTATQATRASTATNAERDSEGRIISTAYVRKEANETINGQKTFLKSIVLSDSIDNPHDLILTSNQDGYAGIWDNLNRSWMCYSDRSGNIFFKGRAESSVSDSAGNSIYGSYVRLSDSQTITGLKTFTSTVAITNLTDNPHTIKLTSDENNYAGIWDTANNKWLLYSDPSGNASFVGNAATATNAERDSEGRVISTAYVRKSANEVINGQKTFLSEIILSSANEENRHEITLTSNASGYAGIWDKNGAGEDGSGQWLLYTVPLSSEIPDVQAYFKGRSDRALADANGRNIATTYAAINSPTLTGTPKAPTAATGTNNTQIATTAFVNQAISNLVDSAPTVLNTLNDIAQALGDDPNFAATITQQLASKANDNNVVHKTGDETIAGFKLFSAGSLGVTNSAAENPHVLVFGSTESSYAGIWDRVSDKWLLYSNSAGNGFFKGTADSAVADVDANPIHLSYVKLTGSQVITGLKTFTSTVAITNLTDNPHTIKLTSDDNNYAGIWDTTNNKWLLYSDNNGNASFVGNATTATNAERDSEGRIISTAYVRKEANETINGQKTFLSEIVLSSNDDINRHEIVLTSNASGYAGIWDKNGAGDNGAGEWLLYTPPLSNDSGTNVSIFNGKAKYADRDDEGKVISTSYVHKTGQETITGVKTFSGSSVFCNAIRGISSDGSGNITVEGGTAATAALLNLYGYKYNADSSHAPGSFALRCRNTDASLSREFSGKPDGTLIWGGQPIQTTSDERLKTPISSIPDTVLDAWGNVSWGEFKFLDAIERKGNDARIHVGLTAQSVSRVFDENNIDACEYGIICHEEKPESEIETVVTDSEAYIDENGIEHPAVTHTEIKHEDSIDLWMVRYTEALCMEAAYQRRENRKLKEQIALLEERLSFLENNLR